MTMSVEQLQQTMMLMNTQIQALSGQLEESKAEIEKLREQSETAWQQQGTRGGGRDNPRPMRLMDMKFRPWAKRVMAFCDGQYPGFRKVMKWCQEQDKPITEALVDTIQWDPVSEANSHLFFVCSCRSQTGRASRRSRARAARTRGSRRGGSSYSGTTQQTPATDWTRSTS